MYSLTSNMPEIMRALDGDARQARSVMREAMNRTADAANKAVSEEMAKVFDRPLPYTLRSLKLYYANTANLSVTLWFKQRSREDDKLWAVTQIQGGDRQIKPMEQRLQRAGMLPSGWRVVPGGAAPLDAYGNMSRGEISRILNVLGTFQEAGYNKANAKTVERLKKGNAKRGVYGFEYMLNPVNGPNRIKHLLPGIYRRVKTGFGSSLKPMMIFVRGTSYRQRLDFFGIVNRTLDQQFPREFDKAWDSLMQTGSASGLRGGFVGPLQNPGSSWRGRA